MSAFEKYDASVVSRLFDGVEKLFELVTPENVARLKDLLKAIEALQAAADPVAQAKAGLDILRVVAVMTPTDADNHLVKMLDQLIQSNLLAQLSNIVQGLFGGGAHAQDVTIAGKARLEAEAAGIPWSFLVQVALQIAQLIEKYKKA